MNVENKSSILFKKGGKTLTSISGIAKPNVEDRRFLATASLGINSFAAGPPSTPKSLNLKHVQF